MSPTHYHNLLHLLAGAILLLKFQILIVETLEFVFGDIVQSILKEDLGSIELFVLQFKFCELDEEVLIEGFGTKFG
jgi:hypothetical protein